MSGRRHHVAGLVLAAVGMLGTAPAFAQGDFLSSSPGPLTSDHKSLDSPNNCNDCHTGGKATSNSKCLGCHDHSNLKRRIRAGKGFHASSKVRGRSCVTCHVEHKGRSFNIMGWKIIRGGMKGFDHDLTGWKLREKHKVLACKECHKKTNKSGKRTFLGESRICGSCHKRDQPHGFDRKAMMKCERCHTETSWKPSLRRIKFDHNKKSDAEFPQEGAHKNVSCGKCHPRSRFNLRKKNPGNCRNCHRSTHDGHLFDKKTCGWCHSPKRKFRDFKFNHRTRTRFSLTGKHARLKCYKCHSKSRGTKKPRRACETCHASDNPHRDRFKKFGKPPRCNTCHNEGSFRPSGFNHARNAGFKLEGKHRTIPCRKCHRGNRPYKWERFEDIRKGQACMNCHQHKNVHNNEFTDIRKKRARPKDDSGEPKKHCLDCHKSSGREEVTDAAVQHIHGPRGTWPLTGGHKKVRKQCGKCHKDDEFKDTPAECGVRCHEDSLHEGRLGDLCTKCHKPGTWKAVRFDHDKDTKWPLVGLHKKVPECEDCHPGRVFANTPMSCSSKGCHAQDDAHGGKLGKRCENCHLETGENIFDHNTQADYKLDGKHLETPCVDCHPKITFKPRPKTCYGDGACHPEPDIHKGQFGKICESCHNTFSFADIIPLHDVGAFSLKGAHDRIPCKRCHKDKRPLGGSGNYCINCHRQDDIHSNALSPRCGECHTQWSFAPARFDHTTVGCSLTGLHRTLPCYDCHKTGNFGGLSPNCYGCHKDTALRVTPGANNAPVHDALTLCGSCHNPNSWVPAIGSVEGGNPRFGRESICR